MNYHTTGIKASNGNYLRTKNTLMGKTSCEKKVYFIADETFQVQHVTTRQTSCNLTVLYMEYAINSITNEVEKGCSSMKACSSIILKQKYQ